MDEQIGPHPRPLSHFGRGVAELQTRSRWGSQTPFVLTLSKYEQRRNRPRWLPPLPDWRALLGEGLDPFGGILGVQDNVALVLSVGHPPLQVHGRPHH